MNAIDQVGQILAKLFPNIELVKDDVEQGFNEPCFFIKTIQSTCDVQPNNRLLMQESLDVVYYPKTHTKSECEAIKYVLLTEFKRMDDMAMRKREAKIVDNVLHYTFNVIYRLAEEEGDTLQVLEDFNGGVKFGEKEER